MRGRYPSRAFGALMRGASEGIHPFTMTKGYYPDNARYYGV